MPWGPPCLTSASTSSGLTTARCGCPAPRPRRGRGATRQVATRWVSASGQELVRHSSASPRRRCVMRGSVLMTSGRAAMLVRSPIALPASRRHRADEGAGARGGPAGYERTARGSPCPRGRGRGGARTSFAGARGRPLHGRQRTPDPPPVPGSVRVRTGGAGADATPAAHAAPGSFTSATIAPRGPGRGGRLLRPATPRPRSPGNRRDDAERASRGRGVRSIQDTPRRGRR